MFSSVCVVVKLVARLQQSPTRTLRQSTPSFLGTPDHATASFTASSAELAAEIGCIVNRHPAKAHMLKLNIVAISIVAPVGRDVDVLQMPVL
jgi:hypothetical protein